MEEVIMQMRLDACGVVDRLKEIEQAANAASSALEKLYTRMEKVVQLSTTLNEEKYDRVAKSIVEMTKATFATHQQRAGQGL